MTSDSAMHTPRFMKDTIKVTMIKQWVPHWEETSEYEPTKKAGRYCAVYEAQFVRENLKIS